MADKCDLCLLGLILLSSLLSGSSGVDEDHVFISSGANVRLSCNNARSDCTSTTWLYSNSFRNTAVVELITGGIKKKDTERHERLSLGSDCSLNINSVTTEDYGLYTCRQYVNGQRQGADARVYLHVLHVSSSSSSSSSQTEISPGRSVTLSCQLFAYPGSSCDDWVRSQDIELLWVNQAGVDLQTDSRYQISAPDRCIRTLTTTLLNEDHSREWRCEVTHRKLKLKTSVTHTVKSSGDASEHSSSAVDSSTLIPVSSSNSQKKSSPTTSAAPTQENQISLTTRSSERTTAHTPVFTTQQELNPGATPNSLSQVPLSVIVIVIVAASFAVLLPALILWLIRKKRAGNRSGTDDSVGQTNDVTYTEVTAYSKNPYRNNKVRCDDKVTYASIRGPNA